MATVTVYQSKITARNSKMPGTSFSLDPFKCRVGGRLAEQDGTVCSKCYARRLASFRPSVRNGWARNQEAFEAEIAADLEGWARRIAVAIRRRADRTGVRFHRWLDAGDLPSVEALKAFVRVAELTPDIRHWLPTREVGIVRQFLAEGGKIPENMVVRASSHRVDQEPLSRTVAGDGIAYSTVSRSTVPAGAHVCPAREQGNACGDCRACWDRSVKVVTYPLH